MNAVADDFADKKIGSVFIYTHEAHPGEHYPHLTSMEQKFRHAADLRAKLNVTRPILADALGGECHRAYGSMPNMTWIFNRAGIVVYKSDWSDAHSVRNALEYFSDVPRRRKMGERLVPFQTERLDYRRSDPQLFNEGLERSGPKAVIEFRDAFGPK